MAGTRRRVTARPRVAITLAVAGVVVLGLAAVAIAGVLHLGGETTAAANQPASWSATHTPSTQSVTEPSRATASPSPSPGAPTGRPTPSRQASVGPAGPVPAGAARPL